MSLSALIYVVSRVLLFVFIARTVAQLFDPRGAKRITRMLIDLTEPILAPIRRILPPMGGFDFSPTIVFLVLFFVSQAV